MHTGCSVDTGIVGSKLLRDMVRDGGQPVASQAVDELTLATLLFCVAKIVSDSLTIKAEFIISIN